MGSNGLRKDFFSHVKYEQNHYEKAQFASRNLECEKGYQIASVPTFFSQNLKETFTPYSGMSLYVMSLYVTVGSEHMVPAALRYLVGGDMSWQKFRKLSKEGVKSKK